MNQRRLPVKKLVRSQIQGQDLCSQHDSIEEYKPLIRKQTFHQTGHRKTNIKDQELEIKYVSPKMNYESMLQYLKNFKFTKPISKAQLQQPYLQIYNVMSQQIYPEDKKDDFQDNGKVVFKELINNENLKIELCSKIDKYTKSDGQNKLLMKSYDKIKVMQQDIRAYVRKNNDLEQTIRKQAAKIIYLEKEIHLQNMIKSKSNQKFDKGHTSQLKHKNTELQNQNREIKAMLYKVTEELKYYQGQVGLLRKKKSDGINLEIKCLKLNEKNRYLQQKIESYSMNKSNVNLNILCNQSEKQIKIELDNAQSTFPITPPHPTNIKNYYFKKPAN